MSLQNVKRYYTDPEWAQRVSYYQQAISQVRVPDQPNPIDVKRIQAQVTNLMDEVLLDLHYARSNWEHYSEILKAAEADLYLQFKNPAVTGSAAPPKRTETEIKSMIQKALNDAYSQNQTVMNLQLGQVSIYAVLHAYKEREGFMKAIQKMLDSKNQAMIVDLGVLKLEFNIDGSRNI